MVGLLFFIGAGAGVGAGVGAGEKIPGAGAGEKIPWAGQKRIVSATLVVETPFDGSVSSHFFGYF